MKWLREPVYGRRLPRGKLRAVLGILLPNDDWHCHRTIAVILIVPLVTILTTRIPTSYYYWSYLQSVTSSHGRSSVFRTMGIRRWVAPLTDPSFKWCLVKEGIAGGATSQWQADSPQRCCVCGVFVREFKLRWKIVLRLGVFGYLWTHTGCCNSMCTDPSNSISILEGNWKWLEVSCGRKARAQSWQASDLNMSMAA